MPSMFDIRATVEFTAMIDELKAEGVWAKIESQELVFINDSVDSEVISKFKNGAILTVYQPTEYDMAGLFEFLKRMSADISGIDTGTDIEIIAVTKRTAVGSVVSEDNIVRLDNIFFYPDISTLVSVDADSTIEDVEKEYIDMQVERWKRYYYWRASLDEKTRANAGEAAMLKSSAAEDNNVIDISRVLSGNYDLYILMTSTLCTEAPAQTFLSIMCIRCIHSQITAIIL
ncbi:MAG: hypothetical protein IKQ95_02015 [Synergistaceae bacterium]|nr:hypothetical protein [Synergistaceae bacterium]